MQLTSPKLGGQEQILRRPAEEIGCARLDSPQRALEQLSELCG